MKTDTIFYQLFQTFPSLVFELMGEAGEKAQGYEFTSREVKELARRFDGVLLPPEGENERLIYFLEVQFQKKDDFYWRFFGEIFVYLSQYQPLQDFQAVAIFASRSCDPGAPRQYQRFLRGDSPEENPLLVQLYLDELEDPPTPSLGLGMVTLVVEERQRAIDKAHQLINQAKQQLVDEGLKQKVVGLIETIMVYKLTDLTTQEIEAMFGLEELKQTRYFQEVAAKAEEKGKLEGKLESVPSLLEMGLTGQNIAFALKLDIEQVQ
ncbi:Rpn family recombination-promoting nuclease/putative transposase [Laspinema sp. D1]|uniref:Rpn family recombination-promoting nuclease/putative transposase n=1 Tax=Laspinema palackyanum D2a TaxID=2953684 RepID=A0ABT2MPQ8_9CYAN|nr:Rpn family recombination-promoting nuclease/putative transposase [Laspinema sp. D2a]